jgi:hypothetical protein
VSKRSGATQQRPSNQSKQARPQNGNGAGRINSASTTTVAKPKINAAQAAAAEEQKRQARFDRQAQNRAMAERRKRMLRIRNIGIGSALVIVLVAVIAIFMINEANKPGSYIPMEPSPHLTNVTDPHAAYSSDPPTSGPHVPQVPAWGVHTEAIAKELQVHALEDAGVVINYRPDIDKATLDKLTALTGTYDKEVLLSPYPGLSDPIVLTAWTRMDKLQTFDEARIQRFISAYKGIDHHKDSGS